MSLFCKMCCGSGEEEAKYGGFVSGDDNFDWDNSEQSDTISGRRKKIDSIEKQISVFNKTRPKGIRGKIYGKPVDLSCVYEPPMYPKSDSERKFLTKVLKGNFIFMDLSEEERTMFIDAMQKEYCVTGTKIIQQGDVGDFFYIVESGTVDFLNGDTKVGSCSKGGSFGELALLYDCPRAVSCIASKQSVSLWKVDQRTFRYLVARHTHDHQKDLKDLVKRINLFRDLDDTTISRFIEAMTHVHWAAGDRIVQKGSVGNVFYIIEKGQAKIHDIGLGDSRFEDMICKEGDWFGERAILTNEPRAANVTALTDVTTLAMDRETFEETIGPLQKVMEREMRKNFLKGLPMFTAGAITDPEIDQLVELMEEVCYRKGEKLVEAGKPFEMNLWIIRHGQLLVYSNKTEKIYNLQSGDYYIPTDKEPDVSHSLLKSILGDNEHVSSHNAVCEQNLTTWVLTRSDIESVIGDIDRLSKEPELLQQMNDHEKSVICLRDLKKHRMLGQGAFGKVWLVGDKTKTSAYALKVISKRLILDSKQEQSVMREKEFLCLLKHPFILQLVSSFQDEDNLYLLLPVVPGGELFNVLHSNKKSGNEGGLPNNDAAFYAGCVIEAIGHFHQRSIAYRDLKLENIMIDEDGYTKVVDLGFAKVVPDKTFTLVGTPEYLAPEIIMSKGHDKAVDYWAYGVLLYELLVGHSPFYKSGSSQIDMFKRIVLVKYETPTYVNDVANELISSLLVRRQAHRLGNRSKGYLDVKAHLWFAVSGITFKKLLKKELDAPWKPEVKDPFDSSNFDDYSRAEKEIDSSKRLTKEEQEIFKGF